MFLFAGVIVRGGCVSRQAARRQRGRPLLARPHQLCTEYVQRDLQQHVQHQRQGPPHGHHPLPTNQDSTPTQREAHSSHLRLDIHGIYPLPQLI